jgi:tyrosinase
VPSIPVRPIRQAPQRLRIRRNINLLTPDQLAKFRAAWKASYALNDNRGYAHFAGLHGLPLPTECSHNDTFWLPWHRAYLYFFEMSLRDIDPTVTLPWWSWASGKLPVAYRTTANANPLHHAAIPANAQVPGGPSQTDRVGPRPGSLPTQAQIDSVLKRGDFLDFSARLRQLHNSVHGQIGGSMGLIENSAFDPIFWAHHSYVDRAWRLWQLEHPSTGLPQSVLNQALAPFPMTVQQTLSVTGLGYDYARSTLSLPFSAQGGAS